MRPCSPSRALTNRYQLALLQDHLSTLYPSPPTGFRSFKDVVDRLLPWHIWQIPDEELEGSRSEAFEAKRVEYGALSVLAVAY